MTTATLPSPADVLGQLDTFVEDQEGRKRDATFRAVNGAMENIGELADAFAGDIEAAKTLVARLQARYAADERRRAAQAAIDAARESDDKFARRAAEGEYSAACAILVDFADQAINAEIQQKRQQLLESQTHLASLKNDIASIHRGCEMFTHWGNQRLISASGRMILLPFWHPSAGTCGHFREFSREERKLIEQQQIRPAEARMKEIEAVALPAAEAQMREIEAEIAELAKRRFDPNVMCWDVQTEAKNV